MGVWGNGSCGEYNVTCKDGSVRICEFFARFISDNLIVTFNDITERKLAETQISQNNANLNALIENTNDFIWSIDRDYKLLTANSEFLKDIQPLYNERLSIGSLMLDKEKLPDELYEKWKNRYDKALSGNKFKAEQVINIRLGNKRFMELSYNPIINDKKKLQVYPLLEEMLLTGKKAEQEISEKKQFYENIIEGVQDGIWVTDENDTIFYANKGMEQIAGIPREKIHGNNVLKDFPKETTEKSFHSTAKPKKRRTQFGMKLR